MSHICSGIVTFYDSEDPHDHEFHAWYLKMRECLEEKLPVVLKETGVFEKKNIDPAKYKISFRKANHVPKQGGVFGDCGVFLCMFLYRNSYSCDELVFDVAYNGFLLIYTLKYGGELLQLKLSKFKLLTYFKMCNLLLDKTKHDIWKWFYCNSKCTVENGLTLVENDKDLKKMYEMANLHGILDVYVSHIPQTFLVDYYLKNLCFDDFDEEVSSILRINEKIKKHIHSMTLEEMIAWEKEEHQSPCYLRSPPLEPKNSFKEFKRKALLDDFDDVEGEGESLGSSSSNFVGSHRSDEIHYDVYFRGCFFMCPLDYQDGQGQKGLTIVENDRDIEKMFELANLQGALDVYVCHVPQPILVDYYFKNLPWVTTLEFINDGREIRGGCFGDIKSYIKNGKLEKVVAIITSCKKNMLGDMNVTLKDPSGTMSSTVHYKVLSSEDGYIKDIKVESALILRNVSVILS
nr:phospholipase-like protein [Tanacetum cinerariifolium]